MKKTADIIGLPVISIQEGTELGIVESFIINANEGLIAALVIDDGKWYMGSKILPFSAISGIGQFAVITEKNAHITPITIGSPFEQLLADDIRVIGTKVLTKTGRIQGKVVEIIIDETGKIVGCEIEETAGEIVHISAQNILTYGRDFTFVGNIDDASPVTKQNLSKSEATTSAQPKPASVAVAAEPVASIVKTPETMPLIANSPEPVAPIAKNPEPVAPVAKETKEAEVATPVQAQKPAQQPATLVEQPAVAVASDSADESSKKFDEKQRKYLLGKKSSRRIETDNGVVIVDQGGEITEEVLQKAKLSGKFVELSMNIL